MEIKQGIRVGLASAALVATSQMGTAASETCLQTSPLDCQRQSIVDHDFSGESHFGANFRDATLQHVDFTGAGLLVSLFDRSTLMDVSFEDANLKGASFTGADLDDVSFEDANLTGARFEGAILDENSLVSAITCNTTMPNELMNNSDCG